MAEQTREILIETSASSKNDKARTMGTRKNPIHFGRVPNTIRNQSEMSYENENTNNGNFN